MLSSPFLFFSRCKVVLSFSLTWIVLGGAILDLGLLASCMVYHVSRQQLRRFGLADAGVT
jgi:hypothetical protein